MDWTSHNGMVVADIETSPTWVTIHMWTSKEEGRGHTIRALKELRSGGKRIEVIDPGEIETRSRFYWMHMQDRGLVDVLRDEYGKKINRKV